MSLSLGREGARWVVGEDVFRHLIELEVSKAARLHYCVSFLYLKPDLPGDPDASVTRRLAEEATGRLRAGDVVATLPAGIGLLLVDAETQALPHIFGRTAGRLELPPEPTSGRPVSWSAGASCYPLTAMTGREMLGQASHLLTQAAREGGGRLCLPADRAA